MNLSKNTTIKKNEKIGQFLKKSKIEKKIENFNGSHDNRVYAKQKLHKAVKVKCSNIVIIDMAASSDKTEH